jgi:hypothetical protein
MYGNFLGLSMIINIRNDKKTAFEKAVSRKKTELLVLKAGPTGLEPATSGVTGRRSNQVELRSRFLE